MSKLNKPNYPKVSFFEFWLFIARELGDSHLTVNPKAGDIHGLLAADSDTKDFLRKAIKKSYKQSKCNYLEAPVNIEVVLDVLGETAYALRDNQRDDLFDIELLEEIGWLISQRYGHYLELDEEPKKEADGHVISFPNYKIRQANTRL